jgi:hypothetical protein
MDDNYRNQEEDLACAGSRGTVTVSEVNWKTLNQNWINARDANIKFTIESLKQKHKIDALEKKLAKASKIIGALKGNVKNAGQGFNSDGSRDIPRPDLGDCFECGGKVWQKFKDGDSEIYCSKCGRRF